MKVAWNNSVIINYTVYHMYIENNRLCLQVIIKKIMACVCGWYNASSDWLACSDFYFIYFLLSCYNYNSYSTNATYSANITYKVTSLQHCALLTRSDAKALFSHNAYLLITAHKNKAKSHIISNLLTLNVWSLWENLTPWPSCIEVLVWHFPIKTLFFVSK